MDLLGCEGNERGFSCDCGDDIGPARASASISQLQVIWVNQGKTVNLRCSSKSASLVKNNLWERRKDFSGEVRDEALFAMSFLSN